MSTTATTTLTAGAKLRLCDVPGCGTPRECASCRYCKAHTPTRWKEQPGRPHRPWYPGGGNGTAVSPLPMRAVPDGDGAWTAALAVYCETHEAPAGVPCYGPPVVAMCGPRIAARLGAAS